MLAKIGFSKIRNFFTSRIFEKTIFRKHFHFCENEETNTCVVCLVCVKEKLLHAALLHFSLLSRGGSHTAKLSALNKSICSLRELKEIESATVISNKTYPHAWEVNNTTQLVDKKRNVDDCGDRLQ